MHLLPNTDSFSVFQIQEAAEMHLSASVLGLRLVGECWPSLVLTASPPHKPPSQPLRAVLTAILSQLGLAATLSALGTPNTLLNHSLGRDSLLFVNKRTPKLKIIYMFYICYIYYIYIFIY